MAAGATGSIAWTMGQDILNMGNILGHVMLQANAEGGDSGLPLLKDSVLNLAKEVSTFSNASKAAMAYRYGLYVSKKGVVQADEIPSEDSFWIALGFNPAEMQDLRIKANWNENRKDIIDNFSKQIRNYRTESFFNPDKRDENARKTEALMNMAPDELRPDIIKQTNKGMPDSFYGFISQKYQEEKVEDNLVERYNH